MSKLITEKIEKVSKDLFKEYSAELTELIGVSPGVYALYNNDKLYYVGKATSLKRRVKQHLADKHVNKWTHFSLFLVSDASHVNAIESLLIAVSYPEGNTARPKAGIRSEMVKKLDKLIREKQNKKRRTLLGQPIEKEKKIAPAIIKKEIRPFSSKANLLEKKFSGKKSLRMVYKGKEFRARLLTNGKIKFNDTFYETPTAAAKAASKRTTINGWWWWQIRINGKWVRLKEIRQ